MSHSYPSDISREQFARILPTLESARRRTKPRTVDLYDVFCGVLYLLKSGCQWRMLPAVFPGLYSQQRHAMLVKQCQLGLGYPVPSPRPTNRPSSPATTGRSSAA